MFLVALVAIAALLAVEDLLRSSLLTDLMHTIKLPYSYSWSDLAFGPKSKMMKDY